MSLSQALAMSAAGLRATQSGLALVASNVANAETPGYVRKTLVQETTTAGASGSSVRVAAIIREFDQYLQRQLRVESSGGAYANLRADFYERLQSIYGEPGSDSTLESQFDKFTQALQGLTTSPDAVSARSAVISSAQVLAQQLKGMTNDIQGLRIDAELGLSDAVSRANNAMTQIAAINRQLASSHANDAASTALMDQRDVYIDQLSQLMDISAVPGGQNQITVFTASGIQLAGTEAATLSFDAFATVSATSQWSADPDERSVGTLTLVSPNGGSIDLLANHAIRSGSIAAYVEMRDHILVTAQNQLDSIAAAMAKALSDKTTAGTAVTSGAGDGFDLDTAGVLSGNTIDLVYSDGTGQHRVTIVRVDDPSALPLPAGTTADPGDEVFGVDFSGGMSGVLSALNARFNGRLSFSNPSGAVLRMLDDGAANNTSIANASITKTLTSLTAGGAELPFFTDATSPYSGAITSLGSQSVGFAGRITVNAALVADPSKLIAYTAGVPAGDATRPNFIYDKLTGSAITFPPATGVGSASNPFVGSLPAFLRGVVSQQGEAAENAISLAQGQQVVLNALTQRVADESSVNIDVEMASLLNLQNSYAANARIMSAVKEMLDMLMNI
jgi:flagellar hook-associated protein 1 FlgK